MRARQCGWQTNPEPARTSVSEVDVASQSSGSASERDGSGHGLTHHASVAIRRSPDDVTRYVFDPTTMPHWSAILYEIEPVTDLQPRSGRRMRANLKIVGVCLTVEGELTEVDPEAREATVLVVPAGGGGSLEHRLAVEASDDGPVVQFWNRVEVPTRLSSTVSDEVSDAFSSAPPRSH